MKNDKSLVINFEYLRDLNSFPLKQEEGGDANPQPGKCNNFEHRRHGGEPIYIMQHHTVGDLTSTIKTFTEGKETSAHFVIDRDGTIYGLVDPVYRAYHAGGGHLNEGSKLYPKSLEALKKNDMNSVSIGIENVNKGNEPYTEAQMRANASLCQYLSEKFPSINPNLMLGHSDWAIGRKIDPSPYFPWKAFANAKEEFKEQGVTKNFGIFPKKEGLELQRDSEVSLSYEAYRKNQVSEEGIHSIQEKLRLYGYDIPKVELGVVGPQTQKAILSFRIHFSGSKIVSDPVQKSAWDDLCRHDSYGARSLLSQFDKNELACLGDVLEQFPDTASSIL